MQHLKRSGREVKRAGDRTFTDWTISVLCDDANTIHEKFIAWSEGFMGLGDTSRGLNYGEWTVAPLSVAAAASGGNGPIAEDENAGKTIQLVDCWPSEVEPLTSHMTAPMQLLSLVLQSVSITGNLLDN